MSKTREDYIEELRWMGENTKYRLRSVDFIAVNGTEDYDNLLDIFGSWRSARHAAGLNDTAEDTAVDVAENLRRWVHGHKERVGCQAPTCDNNDNRRLTFHHVDPNQKDDEISTLVNYGNEEAVREEIKKCVVLCNKCHGQLHAVFDNVERPEWADDYLVENAP